MSKLIIGITGKAGVGKNKVAEYIANMPIGNVFELSVAEPMKEIATILWGWDFKDPDFDKDVPDIKTGIVPRAFLEDFGTDYIRGKWDDTVWTRLLEEKLKYEGDVVFVVTDVRREEEARMIKENGGYIVKVIREGTKVRSNHITNAGIGDELVDWVINNDGTLNDLRNKTETVVRSIFFSVE